MTGTVTSVAEQNILCVRRWLENAEAGFQIPFENFISTEFVGHSQSGPIDLQKLRALELAFAQAFPDAAYEIHELSAVGDKVLLRVTTRGTHKGIFHGIRPTGKRVEFGGLVVYRLANGKIRECWDNLEFDLLMRQITGI